MTQEEFLSLFQEILQREDPVTMADNLLDMEEWDSLSMLDTIAFLDKYFQKKILFEEVRCFDTVLAIYTFATK